MYRVLGVRFIVWIITVNVVLIDVRFMVLMKRFIKWSRFFSIIVFIWNFFLII